MISPVSLSVKTAIPSKSSGRLLDALTDVIPLLTERMGLKADLIRLQREAVAYRVAVIAAKRVRLSKKPVTTVPTKTMVRFLEAASLEEIAVILARATPGRGSLPRLPDLPRNGRDPAWHVPDGIDGCPSYA